MLCPNCGRDNPSDSAFCNACATKLDESQTPTEQIDSHLTGVSTEFVGRQREMGELVSALDDASSGQGRLIMLVGEPGIGKTRTAEELAAYAQEQGSLVLWGRCHEQQGMPPFWPWIQAIRSYVRECEPDQLRSEMGAGASVIAGIVPDVNELLPDLNSPPELESPEQARFRLFDAITTFLKNYSSQSKALVLILDNLHWADKPSLLLLEFLSQELSDSHLMVIGTYRDVDLSRQHPLAETLGELTRTRLFQRVALRGLTLEDEGQLIQVTSGAQPNQEFVELVHSRTEGNPLFIGEVMQMLEQEGSNSQDNTDVRIPEGVREVIGRRLNRLTEQCNQALTVASVIGREFEFNQLVRLVESVSEDGLLESLEEAVSARVIEEIPQSVGRYQFTHALIQQTLVGELSTTRRVRLSVRIIEVFEELYADDLESQAIELAYHTGEAEAMIGSEKLVRYSAMAGESSLATHAYEEALTHFQRALMAREGQPIDEQIAALLHGLGRAQMATASDVSGRQVALDNLRPALDYYIQTADIPQAMAVATPSIDMGGLKGITEFINRALEVAPPDSYDARRLLSRLGMAKFIELGDDEGAQDAFSRALVVARREEDVALEALTSARASYVDVFNLRYRRGLEMGLRAIELARGASEPQVERLARSMNAMALLQIGDLHGARLHTAALLPLGERTRLTSNLVIALQMNERLSGVEGNWREARDFSDRILELAPKLAPALGSRALMEYQVGEYNQGEMYVERFLEALRLIPTGETWDSSNPAVVISLVARITGVTEWFDVAQSTAETVLSSPSVFPIGAMIARAGLALIAVQRGDAEAAEEQYAALESQRGRMLPSIIVSVDRLLGLLAQTMENLDGALTHFEDALTFCRKAGHGPDLAWTYHDYADMLLGANSPDAHRKAVALLNDALTIATELGMRPLAERVTALQERAETLPSGRPTYPDGLTQREVEVLRLIAAGKTDREIGEELFISIRTVGRHVGNILNKTNATNRTEATSYAHEHDLIQR